MILAASTPEGASSRGRGEMKTLFIANRGEIAVRIIRSARELGIETVLAVSEADKHSFAARVSDRIVLVGPSAASESYLSRDNMLDAAISSGADAVHPGYGFLSEDPAFATAVISSGMTWVGPDPESIELMGNKAAAREGAKAAGVPVMVGSDSVIDGLDALRSTAERIGFPLLIKASAGGGGRGIRVVRDSDRLENEFLAASAEALAGFGDASVYAERYIEHARHVEVQILGDGEQAIHLFDRDCSMQRRQQKVVEEAPAFGIPPQLREKMLTAAVLLAKSSKYKGAGTVEFLYDLVRGEICFIEMNTRLQVEHPVTEMITGVDLVREQLLIADGGGLSLKQDDVDIRGHSIEVRICAEDASRSFLPSPGTIDAITWPSGPGVRVDNGVTDGSVVSPYYDSMLAKLIIWDTSRTAAIARMKRSLDETEIVGLNTTKKFIGQLLRTEEFAAMSHHTKFIEQSIL